MNIRSIATPLTIGSFIVSTVTGIILFFHINIGLAKPAHEWLSWFMVVGVALHLAINWRGFLNYFKKPLAIGVIALFSILTVASLLPLTEPRVHPLVRVSNAVSEQSLSTIAEIVKITPEMLAKRLKDSGVNIVDMDKSIKEISEDNHMPSFRVLDIAFNPQSK